MEFKDIGTRLRRLSDNYIPIEIYLKDNDNAIKDNSNIVYHQDYFEVNDIGSSTIYPYSEIKKIYVGDVLEE